MSIVFSIQRNLAVAFKFFLFISGLLELVVAYLALYSRTSVPELVAFGSRENSDGTVLFVSCGRFTIALAN